MALQTLFVGHRLRTRPANNEPAPTILGRYALTRSLARIPFAMDATAPSPMSTREPGQRVLQDGCAARLIHAEAGL